MCFWLCVKGVIVNSSISSSNKKLRFRTFSRDCREMNPDVIPKIKIIPVIFIPQNLKNSLKLSDSKSVFSFFQTIKLLFM